VRLLRDNSLRGLVCCIKLKMPPFFIKVTSVEILFSSSRWKLFFRQPSHNVIKENNAMVSEEKSRCC